MNKSLPLISLGALCILTSLTVIVNNDHVTAQQVSPGKQQYDQFCADCHGKNLETFNRKEWLFGDSDKEIKTSIKYGREIVGMPAFEKTFTDDQLDELVTYIQENRDEKVIAEEVADLTESKVQPIKVTKIVENNEYGKLLWGIDFTPSGKMLITDKTGTLHFGEPGQKLTKVGNLPENILQLGQSGLMDVMVHPDYKKNNFIYLSYTEGQDKNSMKQLVVIRAKLDEDKCELTKNKEIFRALPAVKASHHLGARMVIDDDGYLFIASGERGGNEKVQELSNHFGKMIRLYDDGRIPKDNPFISTPGAKPEIFTLGHRNPQGMIYHPEKKAIIAHEHGPKGGDEINLIEAGKNYGWPSILFGINYNGKPISKDTARAGMEQPLLYWLPSIAPCGMEYVDGKRYPGWKSDILVGSLKFKYVARCQFLPNGKVKEVEALLRGVGRVRSVKADPEGYLYVVTEKPGAVYRLDPQ